MINITSYNMLLCHVIISINKRYVVYDLNIFVHNAMLPSIYRNDICFFW